MPVIIGGWQPLLAQYALELPQTTTEVTQAQPFTIVVLPDTQHYSQYNPAGFSAQTNWIRQNQATQKLVYVTQLGDIVEVWDDQKQWRVADQSMARLDGHIPYGIAPGNHDISPDGANSYFPQYFPASRIAQRSLPIAEFDSATLVPAQPKVIAGRNTYHTFRGGGHDFIAFNLEFCPSDDTLAWVDTNLKRFASHTAIIATHSFLNGRGERETAEASCLPYQAKHLNAGADIWRKLVEPGTNPNILLVLSGHDISAPDGAARRTDYLNGRPVHQLLSNYQNLPNGGDGYLRLLRFDPSARAISVSTYSPTLNRQLTDSGNNFTIELPADF